LPPHDPGRIYPWEPPGTLVLDDGTLLARPASGMGLSLRACDRGRVSIRFRQGGERLRLPGRPGQRALKKLLQEAGIPPWERDRLPLVYIGDALAAVAGHWLCEGFAAAPDEPGWSLLWQPLWAQPRVPDDA